jgi:hypothetical protein
LIDYTSITQLQRFVKAAAEVQKATTQEFYIASENTLNRAAFQEFVLTVQEISNANFNTLIEETSLKFVWYKARYFKSHWNTPTKRSERSMLWTMFTSGFSKMDGVAVILAWWKRHHRRTDKDQYAKWVKAVLTPMWDLAQPRIKEHTEKTMAKERSKLNYQIREELKKGRSTPDMLKRTLDVSDDAIQAALKRLIGKKEITKVGWGVYEIVADVEKSSTPVETNPKIEPAVERQPEPQTHPISKNEHERIFRRLQQMRPDVDRVKFQELISDPDIGLDGIVGTITQYEQQVAR